MLTPATQVIVQVVEREDRGPQYTLTIRRKVAEAMGVTEGEAVNLSIEEGRLIIQRQTTDVQHNARKRG